MVRPATEALPLVVLHGGPGMPSHYLEPLEALATDRPVVLYDQMGTGRSEHPSDPELWTLETFVTDLELLTAALGFDRFHLLGHSWGGTLALAFADRHPDQLASVILSSPLVDVATWCADADLLVQQLPPEIGAALGDPASAGYADAEAEFYRRHFCTLDPWPEQLQRTMDGLSLICYETMWGPNEFTLAGTMRGLDLSATVPRLAMPSLWVCGSEDEARPDTIRAFSQAAPSGQYREFAGASHCVHLEQPDAYLRAVRDFLAASAG